MHTFLTQASHACARTHLQAFCNHQEIDTKLHQLGYRDKAWSVNRLGAVATAHGLPDTCLNILNTMYGYNAMEVQVGGFACLRVQVSEGRVG